MSMCLAASPMPRTDSTYFRIVTISGTLSELSCLALNNSVCNLLKLLRYNLGVDAGFDKWA